MTDPETNEKNPPAAADVAAEKSETPPSTVLIVLGDSLHFEHSGEADVLSVTILAPADLESSLQQASAKLKPSSIATVHVILKAASISTYYRDIVASSFVTAMQEGAEFTVHCLGSGNESEVQANDVSEIRSSLVMAGLSLESEQAVADGGWALTGRKW